jgi:predicted CoA-binding protein
MASKEQLDRFVGADHWAVVGASEDRSKFGNITFRELVSRGKTVYPVNPRAVEVEGYACYPDLGSVPNKVERVLIVVPPKLGVDVVKQALEAGMSSVWFQPGAESDVAIEYCERNGMEAIAGHCILQTR